MKARKVNGVDQLLLESEDEFKKFFPKQSIVKDWRDGQEGNWVLTDDGQVCQVLKRGNMTNGNIKKDYIRTVMGTYSCSSKNEISGDMPKNMYAFGSNAKSTYRGRKDRKETTKKEFIFAQYVAKGENAVDAFLKAFPTKNKDYARRESNVLLNTTRMQKLIREEIDKVMNEAEITPLYILEKMKEIVESTTSRDSDKVSLLKELVAIAGMRDTDKKSESVTVFQGFSNEQLEAIGGNNVKKIASAKKEIES